MCMLYIQRLIGAHSGARIAKSKQPKQARPPDPGSSTSLFMRMIVCMRNIAFDADTLPRANTCLVLKMEEKIAKKKKRGIIYLSTIPRYMNVTKIREIFSAYGQIGRVYLQLANSEDDDNNKVKKKKVRKMPAKHFTEGWVEFESKKVAQFVADTLNNKQVSTRKKSRFYDVIWNIKYLPRFKWIHLSERLAYERAVHKQRLRTEIEQAKRETNFLSTNMHRSKQLKEKYENGQTSTFVIPEIKQRETDMEIRQKKNEPHSEDRTEFLKSLFG